MDRREQRDFEGEPASVHAARQFVAATLSAWELDDLREVAVLLTSELVSNAVLHARTAFSLALHSEPPELTVEVTDGSPTPPVRAPHDPDSERGRGLVLVEAFATRWGTRASGDGGKAVWFVLSDGREPAEAI